jgi:hypothetical protein
MRRQSCNYQQMYDMPCRLACNRYTSVGDNFEGALPLPKESYEYEPEIQRELYVPLPLQSQSSNVMKKNVMKKKQLIQNTQNQSCNCQPKIYIKESYDYDPRLFQQSNTEMYSNSVSGCDCGPMSNYRLQECNYNQSPSWITQKSSIPELPATGMEERFEPKAEDCGCGGKNSSYLLNKGCEYNQSPSWEIQSQQPVNTDKTEGFVPKSEDCGCGSKNSSYLSNGECQYNQSPTWTDQTSFRENVLNKY